MRFRLVLLGLLTSLGLLGAAAAAGASPSAVTEFNASLNPGSSPGTSIVSGPDGDIWFTDDGSTPAIGRITPSGSITEFSTGLNSGSRPEQIVAGPDGNLWFTDNSYPPAIGRITPTGTITEFSTGLASAHLSGIVAGPDGNLWFSAFDPGATGVIGRITPNGTITTFSTGLQNRAIPTTIAAGPDGNVWFIDSGCQGGGAGVDCEIGRITPNGTITEFGYSDGLNADSEPVAIVAGPDGNLWYTDDGRTPAIGRITPTGAISEFSAGLNTGSAPGGSIVAGPDGNVWFTDDGSTPAIGRSTVGGAITESSTATPGAASYPASIVSGPDGNLWFTDTVDGGWIGRIAPSGTLTEFGSAEGQDTNSWPSAITVGADGNLWFTDQGRPPAIGRVMLQLAPAVRTGAAGAITASSASVAGTVNPLGGAVSAISVQYGPSTAYGSSVAASPASLLASAVAMPVTANLTDLPAGSLVHYRVVASNAFGTTTGADQTFSTNTTPPALVPAITDAQESHSTWREGTRLAVLATHRKHNPPLGTRFSFRLNEQARVRFAFDQTVSGRKLAGRRCVAQTKRNRRKPACSRTVTAATLSLTSQTGLNKLVFQGRITASKRLSPGHYTLVITAIALGKSSKAVKLSFTIVTT